MFLLSLALASISPNVFNTETVKISVDKKWSNIDLGIKSVPKIKSIDGINTWVNHSIKYKLDLVDVWKSPNKTLNDGFGDCEDIAILKMAILIKTGYDPKNIFMSIVRDSASRQYHSVIVVYQNNDFLVLDNQSDKVFSHKNYTRTFIPVFSYSINKKWVHSIQY